MLHRSSARGGLVVLTLLGALSAAGSATTQAAAQEPRVASARQGGAVVERLCKGCHLTESGAAGAGSVPAGIPSLRALANRPGQSGERIMNALIVPHTPMPDTQLSRDEIVDIIAYLETLRTSPDVPPLVAPIKPTPLPSVPKRT